MRPLLVAALVFLGTVLLRVPFASQHLYAWDSTLYARALENGFHVTSDMATESPHPPGYIWYVATAALVRAVVHDSNRALVIVSIAASALTAVAFYLIARRSVRESVAIVATLALIVSPVMWLYSEVAYPYALLALLSLVLGWWMIEGPRPMLLSAAFGVLAGFRQDLLLILGPLWAFRVVRLGARRAAVAIAALAAGCVTWFTPSALLSDGLAEYLSALSYQSGTVTGGVAGAAVSVFAFNLALTIEGLLWGILPIGLVLVADALWAVARIVRGQRIRPSGLGLALALWIAPATLFYLLVHIGEWGYVLSVIPPLMLATAIRIDRALPRMPVALWRGLAVLAIALPALAFLTGDSRFSASRLRERELELSSGVPVLHVRHEPVTEAAPPTMGR